VATTEAMIGMSSAAARTASIAFSSCGAISGQVSCMMLRARSSRPKKRTRASNPSRTAESFMAATLLLAVAHAGR
jgi:hypothetical protein